MNTSNGPVENKRATPRADIPLEVDVEVAGETRKVLLISKDISAGGMFLRTEDPASLFRKVKLVVKLPDGERFEVSGEVVRRIDAEQARQMKHPPGMAVAFDEISRSKRKKLIALVLDLVSARPPKKKRVKRAAERKKRAVRKEQAKPSTDSELARQVELALQARLAEQEAKEPKAAVTRTPPELATIFEDDEDDDEDQFETKTDALLGQLDELLDTVENDVADENAVAGDASDMDIGIEMPKVDFDLDLDDEEPPLADEPSRDDPQARLRGFLDEYNRNLKGDTHYDVLGLDSKASAQQIEAAYRRLLDDLKPPSPPESLSDDLIRDLSSVLGRVRKAFAILAKPDRRRAYDFLIDKSDDDI